MKTLFRSAAFAVAMWALASAATAAPATGDPCTGGEGITAEQQIAACTAIIESADTTEQKRIAAYKLRFIAYYATGQFDLSLADTDKLVELLPNDPFVHYNRGVALGQLQRRQEALREFDSALQYAKESDVKFRAEVFRNRGIAHGLNEAYEQALADFLSAIELDPTNGAAQAGYAHTLEKMGRIELAIAAYDRAAELKPNDATILNQACWLRAVANIELQLALQHCTQGLEHAPDDPTIFDSRAFVYLRLGRFDLSIADYDVAVRLQPGVAHSLYGRGLAHRAMGSLAQAEADMAAAKALDPVIAETFAGYGVQ